MEVKLVELAVNSKEKSFKLGSFVTTVGSIRMILQNRNLHKGYPLLCSSQLSGLNISSQT